MGIWPKVSEEEGLLSLYKMGDEAAKGAISISLWKTKSKYATGMSSLSPSQRRMHGGCECGWNG